ncbi:DMT family transporter [Miltoncostaea oceani]|uniref:DMT family transporter n=1 Tax=Miltoncostaea oceani TaxID=2843216 RepID=UPI001C3C6804|nr:DMT family transporter [Miltoncostaea oceani]
MRLSRLQVIGAAALFSTGGAAIKGTSYTGIPEGLEVAGFRSGIGALVIALVLPASRRGWTWRTWAVGAAYAATVILFVLANKQTTSANAIFLQSAAPLYVLVAGVVVLRERVRRPDVLLMLVLVAGLSLFLVDPGDAVATAPDPALGNALAAASGVTWAATLLGLRWLGRGAGGAGGAAGATVTGNLIAAAICIPTAIPPTGDAADWLLIAYLGVAQIGLAYVLLTSAVRHVPAFEVSLLLLVEPALNPVWSWIVHGERPGGAAIAGGLLILGATAAKVALDGRRGTTTALEPPTPAAPP